MALKRVSPKKTESTKSDDSSVDQVRPSLAKRVKVTSTLTKPVRVSTVKKVAPGKISEIRHFDFTVRKPVSELPSTFSPERLELGTSSPKHIEISLEPMEDGKLVLHHTPGFTSQEPAMAQLSVLALVHNKGAESVDLDKVILEYKIGNQTSKKEVYLPSDELKINVNEAWYWQNSRDYHQNGDVVFLVAPFPTAVKLSFYFKGYTGAVTVSKSLKNYTAGLAFPFSSVDFKSDEFVTGYSMHGGGSQVFAYDMGVQRYENDKWSDLHPGKDGSENDHYRIWGKPVRAMADGVVIHFQNNITNNWKPDGSDSGMKKQKDELWGSFDQGHGGNHVYVKHGNVVALYAHLQKGSLPAKFCALGASVKQGETLGKAGNSGNSTGPHLHVHLKTYKSDDKPEGGIFRPLVFNTGYAIGQANYPKPDSNVNWSKLNNQGIPGLKSKACFIYPSATHPYCSYPTNWGEVARHGVPASKYQTEFDKIWPCGYYPVWVDGYEVSGKTYFNMIFRPSKSVSWVARHGMDGSKYQDEFDKWNDAGYRLINVNSYVSSGKVRYAAVWIKDSSVASFAYHGRSLEWHEANFKKHHEAGYVPVNASCVILSGKTYVTALWEKKSTGGFYLRPAMSLSSFKTYFDQYTNKEKFKLVYLDAYMEGTQPRLSGIWYKKAPDFNSWYEKYNLDSAEYQDEYTNMINKGYLTRCVAGYNQGSVAKYEGIWSK